MAIGNNKSYGTKRDELIINTSKNDNRGKTRPRMRNGNTVDNVQDVHNVHNVHNDTKVRKTVYLKREFIDMLENFAWWERYSITDALNIVIKDGLGGKNTKSKERNID